MIGQRIQQLRLQKRMSLSALADHAGIAKSYISAIERDIQSNPSIQVIEKICAALNVPVTEVIVADEHVKDLPLDQEWLEIVQEAMQSGVDKEAFRNLLEFQKWQRSQQSE